MDKNKLQNTLDFLKDSQSIWYPGSTEYEHYRVAIDCVERAIKDNYYDWNTPGSAVQQFEEALFKDLWYGKAANLTISGCYNF